MNSLASMHNTQTDKHTHTHTQTHTPNMAFPLNFKASLHLVHSHTRTEVGIKITKIYLLMNSDLLFHCNQWRAQTFAGGVSDLRALKKRKAANLKFCTLSGRLH